MAAPNTYAALKEKYEKAGQSQVLSFWSQLPEAEQVSLSNQLAALDIERVNRVFAKAIESEKDAQNSTQDEITPPPSDSFDSILGDEAKEAEFRKIGLQAIAEGKVGVLLMAGTLPCLDNNGKVLLDSRSSVAVAPDGNGGLYAALRSPISPGSSTTVLSDLAARKIAYIHAYCVDNCLVRVADPVFLGAAIHKNADCAAKVVPKTSPTESVGVVARKGGRFGVVEYSEISKEQAERRDPDGQLAFRAGNIANHFYTTEFLNRVAEFEDQMAFHIARKKIPHVDLETGEQRKPTKPNGMKLELFVFDVFPFTQHMSILEVDRKEEFSPLKNAPGTGSDDPQTSRADLLAQQRRWLEKAGATVAEGVEIEISPKVSYAGEGLEEVKGKTFTRSGLVENVHELDSLV
ncbi:UDP-N-acetylglucosamine pyrophosphorylase [Ceratobasidium sp. 370]|nr:UDP-N-acetylglucosamine pyrophosphorylase [Ceratobasidium sp. 370]